MDKQQTVKIVFPDHLVDYSKVVLPISKDVFNKPDYQPKIKISFGKEFDDLINGKK